ncbi:MAG: alginate lyase family protein [Burkholderiaceae bacterium]|nr:alginate lyase family protein [Burkholderiaceae bacterium]
MPPEAMYRHLQQAMRLARKALRRRVPRRRATPYRPRFDEKLPFPVDQRGVFFADSERIRELAARLCASKSPWVAHALSRVHGDRTAGLRVYSKRAPKLDRSFPWGALEKGPGDDVLYAVRPHRFAFAPRFALAILYEDASPDVLADILEGWVAFANGGTSFYPYLSTLVVIQRSLALSWAYAFVSASSASQSSAGVRVRSLILKILQADIDFLFLHLGTGYPNNHLLVERFAAWYFAVVFPEMVPGRRSADELEREFTDEMLRQTYPDGGGFEHSLHYHEFGCEMAAAYLQLNKRRGRSVLPVASERVRRMLEFQVELGGPDCLTHGYGNGTEDPLFPLDSEEGYATAALRELYRSLFCAQLSPAPSSSGSIERAFWLLGGEIAQGRPDAVSSTGMTSWEDSGFHLFTQPGSLARVIFRTGPPPSHDPMPGHMHADWMSVYASCGVQPLLVDSGTWSYRLGAGGAATAGRQYFAGPSSHNALVIDEVDPLGTLHGDFREGSPPVRVRRRCLAGEDRLEWVECEVVGESLYAGHRRGVVHVEGHYWILYDRLPAAMPAHCVRLKFQAPPSVGCRVTDHDFALVEGRDARLWIAKGSTLARAGMACGEREPPGGWYSPRYGEVLPAPQLSYTLDNRSASAALVFGFGPSSAFPVDVEELDGGLAIRCRREESTDLLLVATDDEPIRLIGEGWRQNASLVWSSRSGRDVQRRRVGWRSPVSGSVTPAANREDDLPRIEERSISGAGSVVSMMLGARQWQ